MFSYKLVSGIELEYKINNNNQITSSFELLNEGDIDWYNNTFNPNIYIVPITGYPIAMVHTITALGNQSLFLTREAIREIISAPTMFLSDPLISDFNPALASSSVQARMALDSNQNQLNYYLIDYFFPEINNTGSWFDIKAPRHSVFNGPDAVMSAMTVLTNYIAFIPYPLVKVDTSGKTRSVKLLLESDGLNSTYNNVSVLDNPSITLNKNFGNVIPAVVHRGDIAWPLNQMVYFIFPENFTDCNNITKVLRFVYWVLNTTDMTLLMGENGYFDTSADVKDYVKEYLKRASCIEDDQLKTVLSYTNLSNQRRSSVVFGISVACVSIFIGVIIYGWWIGDNKSRIVWVHNIVVLFGLAMFLSSFFIYWWPASSTIMCRARYWTLALGYVNVISAVLIWASIVHYFFSNDQIPKSLGHGYVVGVYSVLNIINIILLVLWTLIGNPISREIVVSGFDWTTRYECYTSNSAPDYAITAYHLLISAVGCGFLYRLWQSKTTRDVKKITPDDIRFLMICLYNQIAVFLLLFVIKNLILTDDQEYVIVVPLFLFLIANVILSLFIPRILNKLKSNLSGSGKSDDGQGKTEASASKYNISTVDTRRSSINDENSIELPKI